jgi:hypothetical protein
MAGSKPRTHCYKGHPFTPENTKVRADGFKSCRECDNNARRAWRARKRCSFAGCDLKAAISTYCVTHWHEAGGVPSDNRRVHPNGYVIIGTHTLEHRWIMSQMVGRPLKKGETVHHRNGNRADNRPENLQLMVYGRHPSGQRVEDLVEWAQQILHEYEAIAKDLPRPIE